MSLFDNFPFTNMHQLNLNWILKTIKEFTARVIEAEGNINGAAADSRSAVETASEALQLANTFENKLQVNSGNIIAISDSVNEYTRVSLEAINKAENATANSNFALDFARSANSAATSAELKVDGALLSNAFFTQDANYPNCWYLTIEGERFYLNPPMLSGVWYNVIEHTGSAVLFKRVTRRVGNSFSNFNIEGLIPGEIVKYYGTVWCSDTATGIFAKDQIGGRALGIDVWFGVDPHHPNTNVHFIRDSSGIDGDLEPNGWTMYIEQSYNAGVG